MSKLTVKFVLLVLIVGPFSGLCICDKTVELEEFYEFVAEELTKRVLEVLKNDGQVDENLRIKRQSFFNIFRTSTTTTSNPIVQAVRQFGQSTRDLNCGILDKIYGHVINFAENTKNVFVPQTTTTTRPTRPTRPTRTTRPRPTRRTRVTTRRGNDIVGARINEPSTTTIKTTTKATTTTMTEEQFVQAVRRSGTQMFNGVRELFPRISKLITCNDRKRRSVEYDFTECRAKRQLQFEDDVVQNPADATVLDKFIEAIVSDFFGLMNDMGLGLGSGILKRLDN